MNRALWLRTWQESRVVMFFCAALLFAFNWLFVWLSNQIKLGDFSFLLNSIIPPEWQKISPIPMAEIATPAGRIVLAYIDPVTLIAFAVWAIGRGSDAVSGQLGRGTLEMVVAQPLRRWQVLLAPVLLTTLGSFVLAIATWLGTCTGLATVTIEAGVQISPLLFVPAALNLFAFAFFLGGATTLVSSCDRFRGRTIGIACGFYVASLIIKIIARMAPGWEWMMYLTCLGPLEPQIFVSHANEAWWLSLQYDGLLVSLGVATYAAALLIFSRRDLPAPI